MRSGEIREVAIVGAGLMGSGLALEYAAGGFPVSIVARTEASAQRALDTIASNLHFLVEQGLVDEDRRQRALRAINVTPGLEEAVKAADLVVECIPEDLALKQQLFSRLEALCKEDAILATNTSSLGITRIASPLHTAHRVVGTHYWNPPYLMPLVEIVAGEKTSPQTVATMKDLLQSIGKIPVIVKKDLPGFIWNRIQVALLRECLHLVEMDVASMEDIDLVVKKGLGRRLSLIGPFETVDLGGLDVFHSICANVFPDLGCETAPSHFFTEKVEGGELGVKTGKGFYEWSQDKARNIISSRNCRLGELLRQDCLSDSEPSRNPKP